MIHHRAEDAACVPGLAVFAAARLMNRAEKWGTNMKRMLALLAACAMLCTLAACGQQEEGSAAGSGNAAPTDSVQDSATDSKPADSTAPGDSSKAEESGSDSRKDPDAREHSESSGTDSAVQSPEHNGDTSSGPGTENSQPDNPSGEQKPAASTPTQPEQQSPTATTAAQEDSTPASDVKTITLLGDSVRFEGKGIAARGSKVGITKGGTYRISGSLSDGQIEINTEKKVVLQLDGVSIKNSAGSAINVINAKRVNVELMPGTVNSLEDGSIQHDADKGALFSNDTLEIGGSGTLNIRSNYAHGIASDDDIIVNGGRLHIVSTKSGLFANDDITINGGTLYCDAGTNGIKCKNTISINGGTSVLMGGTREEKGAVIAVGGVTINGGTLDLTCNGNGDTALDADGTYTNNGGEVTTNDGSEENPGAMTGGQGGGQMGDGHGPSEMPRQEDGPQGRIPGEAETALS